MFLLTQDARVERPLNALADGQGSDSGNAVDASAYDGVTFACLLGAITAGGSVALGVEHSDDGQSWDAAEGSVSVDDTGSDKVLLLEVSGPTKRYVRPVVSRTGANAVIDGVLAISTRGRSAPAEHGAEVESALVLAPGDA